MSPDDVVQRVMLKLLEKPPASESSGRALVRLIAWTNTVTRNYIYDLLEKRTESFESDDSERTSQTVLSQPVQAHAERRLVAQGQLRQARDILENHYPAGVALFELLLRYPLHHHHRSCRLDLPHSRIHHGWWIWSCPQGYQLGMQEC